MLYIKFEINNLSKYSDFQKLFNHMQETRKAYDLEEFEEEEPEYDWENMTEEEYQKILNEPIVSSE